LGLRFPAYSQIILQWIDVVGGTCVGAIRWGYNMLSPYTFLSLGLYLERFQK